jgi:hypothetical protein
LLNDIEIMNLRPTKTSVLWLVLALNGCASSDDGDHCRVIAVNFGGLGAIEPGCRRDDTLDDQDVTEVIVFLESFDVEPNDSIASAAAATFPFDRSRVGFLVNGTINNLIDGVDVFAFTPSRSRRFRIKLCDAQTCDASTDDGFLATSVAYVAIINSLGRVLASTEGQTEGANVIELLLNAGVVYYVMVVGVNTDDFARGYRLLVFEANA